MSEVRDFALFLRPFETDSGLKYKPFSLFGATGVLSPKYHLDDKERFFEQQITYALKSKIPLVSIGGIEHAQGPGRVKAGNNDWQEKFVRLAQHAREIFVVPLSNKWTKWEVERLRDANLLPKTLMLMPPKVSKYPIAKKWNDAAAQYRRIGITLPKYMNSGCIFHLNLNEPEIIARGGFGISKALAIKYMISKGHSYIINAALI